MLPIIQTSHIKCVSAGWHTIKAKADLTSVVLELNETNNEKSYAIFCNAS
ncbi:hypothetical protein MSIBF_A370003 [groundwater metagenome]|uniref:CARDB domain-containing protein n=1 Tax=groundwater metagenome TaxID=717931 RepID=A0A098EBE3_9ZZZZ